MTGRGGVHFLDRPAARFVAGLVALLALAAIGYLSRERLFETGRAPAAAAANPEFILCRDQRLGHVRQMLQEGVIDEQKLEEFSQRAISYCAAQFPPESKP
jgi:hypothetical protein